MVLFIAIQITQKKINRTKEKGRPFECGLNIMSPSHIPFSFQFFLVALLFLIFDVEIAIILSYPIERTRTKNITAIFSFLIVLTIGLIYE
jgi:NADH:ubiquinone oxidoreductase subunit 3 (subunit A)